MGKQHENLILEIVKRYGDVINLRESPYLLVEIIRHYRNRFDDLADADSPCAGVPPIPPPQPPGPSSFGIRGNDLLQQMSLMVNIVENINSKLSRVLAQSKSAKKRVTKSSKKSSAVKRAKRRS